MTSHVTTEKTMEEVDTEALRELARETVMKGRETDRESPGMTRAPDITLLVGRSRVHSGVSLS